MGSLGIAARKRVVDMFPEEQGTDRYEEYCRKLLNNINPE